MRISRWPWSREKKDSEVSIEIIPTCVPLTEKDLENVSKQISEFADWIHVDVGDGAFSPTPTWPCKEQGDVGGFDKLTAGGFDKLTAGGFDRFDYAHGKQLTAGELDLFSIGELKAEVHLMTEEPAELGMLFARAGARRVTGHIEAFSSTDEAHGALDLWRRNGAQAGLGMLFYTPFEVIEPLLAVCDVVHMMSISTIGTQGIPYEPSAPERIAEFHDRHPDILISVDGGVSEKNIEELVRAGARRFGVGSAIMRAADPAAAYKNLKALAESAI